MIIVECKKDLIVTLVNHGKEEITYAEFVKGREYEANYDPYGNLCAFGEKAESFEFRYDFPSMILDNIKDLEEEFEEHFRVIKGELK